MERCASARELLLLVLDCSIDRSIQRLLRPCVTLAFAGTPDDKKLGGWTAGALVFYSGGTYGHVAICAEDSGVIFSTDLPRKGKVTRAHSRIAMPRTRAEMPVLRR